MKKTILVCMAACGLLAQGVFAQTTYYVANNGANNYPYTNSWADAATNIHDVVTLAVAGDTILVTNGSYRLTNTIVVATNFTVRSVNGPDVTTLWRSANSFGIFVVSNANALVTGFTLTNGPAVQGSAFSLFAGTVSNCTITKCGGSSAIYMGGGLMTCCVVSNNATGGDPVYVNGGIADNNTIIANSGVTSGGLKLGASGLARRCKILFNRAGNYGPGGVFFAYGGRLENSLVYGNYSTANNCGGGIYIAGGSMVNCTITGNSAPSGPAGGVYWIGGVMTNCIIYGNTGFPSNNYSGPASVVWYSCVPELASGVQGNITAAPFFVDAANGDFRQAAGSPCVDTGTNVAGITTDIDGRSRPLAGSSSGTLRNDMGAYEKDGTNCPFEVGFSASPVSGFDSVQCVLTAAIAGTNTTITWWGWDFDNNGSYERSGAGLAVVTNTFGPGRYSISLRVTNSIGETAVRTNVNCVLVTSSNIYVSATGGNVLPYNTWANAATNIHDAVGVALPGCTVWVTNGSYRMTNQIPVFSGFAVRGVNGPDVTTVWRDTAFGSFGLFDIRSGCALISDLTMTNGSSSLQGAAVGLVAGTVSNCTITRCGGASAIYMVGGLMTHCVVSNNACSGGAVYVSGGVAEDSTIITNYSGVSCGGLQLGSVGVARRCRIMFNRQTAGNYGPGGVFFAYGGRLENSLVYGNYSVSSSYGGGVRIVGGSMINCTIAKNLMNGNGDGVEWESGAITNCIIYGNGTNGLYDNYFGLASAAWYTCAPELTNGVQGNITNDPLFVAAAARNYRLKAGSPCINTGTNQSWMFPPLATAIDLDGNKRVFQAIVDMGAYEAAFQGTIFTIR